MNEAENNSAGEPNGKVTLEFGVDVSAYAKADLSYQDSMNPDRIREAMDGRSGLFDVDWNSGNAGRVYCVRDASGHEVVGHPAIGYRLAPDMHALGAVFMDFLGGDISLAAAAVKAAALGAIPAANPDSLDLAPVMESYLGLMRVADLAFPACFVARKNASQDELRLAMLDALGLGSGDAFRFSSSHRVDVPVKDPVRVSDLEIDDSLDLVKYAFRMDTTRFGALVRMASEDGMVLPALLRKIISDYIFNREKGEKV